MEERATVRIRPPHGEGTTDRNRNIRTATGAASTAAIEIVPTAAQKPSTGVWITLICTEACRIRFGDSSVGAATTSDHLIPANTYVQYWCNHREDTHFRVIRVSADGLLDHYISE